MSNSESVAAPSLQHTQVLQRIDALEQAFLKMDPEIKTHLREIHKLLIGHQELVHLLTEEQIAKIMAAQQRQTDTSLIADSNKSKASATKKAAKITIDDI